MPSVSTGASLMEQKGQAQGNGQAEVHPGQLAGAENPLLLLKDAKAGYKGERKSLLKITRGKSGA